MLISTILVVDCVTKSFPLVAKKIVGCNFIQQIHYLYDIMLRICKEIVEGFFQSGTLNLFGCFHSLPLKRVSLLKSYSTTVDYSYLQNYNHRSKGYSFVDYDTSERIMG